MRTTTDQQAWLRSGIILTAVAIIFVLDRLGPSKLAVEILYLPLILCAAWILTPKWTWRLYFLCAALITFDTGLELSGLSRQEFWLRITNTAVETLMGAVVTGLALLCRGYATKLRDTCSSLQASEDQLRRSEALYRSLVENIPQCVFRKDLEGRFTYANSRFCDTVGRTVDQVIGATDFDHCPPHLAIKYRADDRRVAESGLPMEIIEDLQMPDGKICQLQTLKTPVHRSARPNYRHPGSFLGHYRKNSGRTVCSAAANATFVPSRKIFPTLSLASIAMVGTSMSTEPCKHSPASRSKTLSEKQITISKCPNIW